MKKLILILIICVQSINAQVLKSNDFENIIEKDSTNFSEFCLKKSWEFKAARKATKDQEGKITYTSFKPTVGFPNNRIEYVYNQNPTYTRINFRCNDDMVTNKIVKTFKESGYKLKSSKTVALIGDNKLYIAVYENNNYTLVLIHTFYEGIFNNQNVVFGNMTLQFYKKKDFEKNNPFHL